VRRRRAKKVTRIEQRSCDSVADDEDACPWRWCGKGMAEEGSAYAVVVAVTSVVAVVVVAVVVAAAAVVVGIVAGLVGKTAC